jgi:hypothetical protein
VELIATASYHYAGERLKAGDKFTATDRDARLLTLVGKAKEAAKPKKVAAKKIAEKGKYARSDMHAEDGEYARRDLRAEG